LKTPSLAGGDADCSAVFDGLGAVAGVGEGLGDAGVGGADAGEQADAAGVVGHVGGGDPGGQKQAEGVDGDVAFAAEDPLAHVDALVGDVDVGGGLDGLAVEHAGARLGVAAGLLPDEGPRQTVELLEDAVLLPAREVPGDRDPRGEVVREVAPGDAVGRRTRWRP
jgi:hypothetical protein